MLEELYIKDFALIHEIRIGFGGGSSFVGCTCRGGDRAPTENRELSDDDRVEMFRQQFIQAALPDLPKIPGYQTCWLTTTNPRDSIQARIRLGYEPIKPEEVPGWEYASIKTGEWTGFFGVNEMLAFKLPMALYKRYMQEVHFDAPNQEEERLLSATEGMREQAERAGSKLVEGDGMSAFGNLPRYALLMNVRNLVTFFWG